MVRYITGTRESGEQEVVRLFKETVEHILKGQESLVLGICGGTSFNGIYQQLSSVELDWSKIHFFFVDERFVPLDHADSNYFQLKPMLEALVAQGLPTGNIHPYDLKRGVASYQAAFDACGGKFDVLFLGAGGDGHVASLFPQYTVMENQATYFAVDNSPKPPSKRITASRQQLQQAKAAFVAFFGEGKREAYLKFKDPAVSFDDCPAKLVEAISEAYVVSDLET